MNPFTELSVIIVIVAIVSVIMRILKQPLVVGYIFSGIIVGPYMFNILQSEDQIELFSKIGISILLFIVGLSLSPHVVKEVGKVSLITGIGQVLFTSIVGFFICIKLGLTFYESIFTSVAITFSSTIIVLKLLTDKGDLNKLYGKVAIGFLLVQDVLATIILIIASTFGAHLNSGGASQEIFSIIIKGVVVFSVLFFVGKKVLPKATAFFASSQEFLFVFSLAWGFGISSLFYYLGFSIEIGALIAGVTLAVSPFAYEISSRMRTLRDFFILLFFILLGSRLVLGDISGMIYASVILSSFILIGNPLIVFFIMNILGFKTRTSFSSGLTVAQISEFSLILMGIGASLNLVSQSVMSLVTIVGLITIAGSTYLIMYSDIIYKKIEPLLKAIEIIKKKKNRGTDEENSSEVVLFGFGRVGLDFVDSFEFLNKKFIVIDFNPNAINRLKSRNIPFKYGDAEDVEFLSELDFKNVKLVVSTIPDFDTNQLIVNFVRLRNPEAIIIVLSHDEREADKLYKEGASYVVMPHYLGAKHASQIIRSSGFEVEEYEGHKKRHLDDLSIRRPF